MSTTGQVKAREELEDLFRRQWPSWTPETVSGYAGNLLRLPSRTRDQVAALLAPNGRPPARDTDPEGPQEEREPAGPRVRVMADVEPEEVRWLWGARIPRAKLSEIVGDPGEGKSWLTMALVGLMTSGRPLPGDPDLDRPPERVVLVSAEDGPEDTIRPRLDAAGADLDRVHILDGIVNAKGFLDLLNLQEPLHRLWLADLVTSLEASVLIIDPLSAYLGSTDSYRDSEVRGILAPLANMAERTGAAVLTVRHLTKGSASRAIYRAGGSIGFTAAVRNSMLVGRVEEGSEERACLVIKSNLAAFPDPVGFTLEGGSFQWTATPKVTAGDLLRGDGEPDDRRDRADAVEWLRAFLARGPQASTDLFKAAERELGVSEKTIKRARHAMEDEIIVERLSEPGGERGAGRWIWRLRSRGPHPQAVPVPLDPVPLEQPYSHKGYPPDDVSRGTHPERDPLEPLEGQFGDLFADGGDR